MFPPFICCATSFNSDTVVFISFIMPFISCIISRISSVAALLFVVAAGFLAGVAGFFEPLVVLVVFVAAGFVVFFTRSIPHFGHLPGLVDCISGCIGQV